MAGQASTSRIPSKAFSLEPFSYADARALMEALDLPEPVAVTLVRRGYGTVVDARAFLDASETHDPFAFDSMRDVTATITRAVADGRTITVHGDYDCDGVSATAILVRALRQLSARCDWFIPDRMGDGYGLTRDGVDRLAARGTGLLITVDCGITCPDEVAAAGSAGMDVIVTDHHEPGPTLPDCPILHPRLSGYPFGELCAAGVAYKLAAALLGVEEAERDLDLVALATVADLVPLRAENRGLVRKGLAVARRASRPGLRALCAAASVAPERLDEGDLAFRLGPRINAAGRLYRADAGVELMLTSDEARATAIATELNRANGERRTAEREVVNAAESARTELPEHLSTAPALVLAGTGWHPGVVGIAASRLAERHFVPTVLIGIDSEGRGRGSGRSIPGFDLLAALDACGEHLTRYGGHRAAAGLEIEAQRIDAFREAFVAHAATVVERGDLVRTESIDAVVGGESLGHEVAEHLERLAPFGMGNPGVRLLVPSVRVCDVRPMGDGDKHARFQLESGARTAMGVAFSVNGKLAEAGLVDPVDVSVKLELNEWNGAVEPRVILGELYRDDPPALADDAPAYPDAAEWTRRFDAEREAPLAQWPPEWSTDQVVEREVVDRRGDSGVAAVASLASCREPVLVLCADALRRRELVERAADPARFCGGPLAIASGRLADDAVGEGIGSILRAGCGVALADWGALERMPEMAAGFAHVLIVDPPPFPHLERAASAGTGFVHLAWGEAEAALALRVHEEEWPRREALAALYRVMRDRHPGGTGLREDDLRKALDGPGRHPRAPEAGARRIRVLEEVGAVEWDPAATARALRVVSSVTKDLELTKSFVAYRERYEEGRRFLSRRRQPN
ncbi:MAG TPA: single-stranded-DNA-specific exonuclease RecJ [Solirubrobacterales bacterium]|nr:single-stranded-DNA-specific exonuclease RecJ [Solirubrobacterales bacterium]